MDSAPAWLTLLTDFGTDDVFVGVMKGVIAGIAPSARVIDLCHGVPPQDVGAGAFYLQMAWRHFPAGTVHVVVVDPGVGTERRPLAAAAAGHFFVGPDNGVLAAALANAGHVRVVAAENRDFWNPAVSTTFHGRDVFAPVGAYLARGTDLTEFGPLVDDWQPSPLPVPEPVGERGWRGAVCWVDHFGNVVSNLGKDHLPDGPTSVQVRAGGRVLSGLADNYSAVAASEFAVLVNSFGFLEIACRGGQAARELGIGMGAPVEVTW